MQLTFLNDIKPRKTGCRIQVKNIHTWRHFMKDVGESLEIILCDANVNLMFYIDLLFLYVDFVKIQANGYNSFYHFKGNKIHASCNKTYFAEVAKHVRVGVWRNIDSTYELIISIE